MSNIRLRCAISLLFASATLKSFALPEQQELTLTALTEPVVAITVDETREVQYKLTNNSTRAYQLTMKPMTGIKQQFTKAGSCEKNISLAPGESCTVYLLLEGKELSQLEQAGPIFCENAWNWHDEASLGACVQPKAEERLHVQQLPIGQASLSLKIEKVGLPVKAKSAANASCYPSSTSSSCTLALFQGTGTQGRLQITNTSHYVARSIQAYGLPAGVTQDASACTQLSPGQSCNLLFYPGDTKVVQTTVSIKGTNTPTAYIVIQVLGIGDTYNGGQLFELPTASNDYQYSIVASADATTCQEMWADAANICAANDASLPTPSQLQELYQASNCSGGPIGGFNCCYASLTVHLKGLNNYSCSNPASSSPYWTNENCGDAAAIDNFSSGQLGLLSTQAYASVRCVQTFQLAIS